MTTSSSRFGFRSVTLRLIVWVLASCGVIYVATLVSSNRLSRRLVVRTGEKEAANAARAAGNEIESVLLSVEESTRLLALFLETTEPSREELDELLGSFVASHPYVFGSTAAFVPYGFSRSVARFAPYRFRRDGSIDRINLATDSYRYWEKDWYTAAERTSKARWSDPYLDVGGGEVLMVTFSLPFFERTALSPHGVGGSPELSATGVGPRRQKEMTPHAMNREGGAERLRGVVTADLALDWLNERIGSIRVGRTGYGILLTRSGHVLAQPAGFPGRLGDSLRDLPIRPEARAIAQKMIQGESGFIPFLDGFRNQMSRLAYAPVGKAGWSLAVLYPEEELMADTEQLFRLQVALGIVGLLLLVGVVILLSRRLTRPIRELAGGARRIATGDLDLALPPVRSEDEVGALTAAFHHMRDSLKTYIQNLKDTTAAKQKLESELQIARKIQMAMLPSGKSGGGKEAPYELAATVVPARAVGGDLYAYFRVDRKLAFLVGDVSGKGVPAALFMARTMTLFETLALREPDLSSALGAVNRALCAENEAGMFVTVFCAVLDLASGELRYTGGGHDAPVLVPARGGPPRQLTLDGGPVVGLLEESNFPIHQMSLESGDLLVLYTDGVSEALNEGGDFFTIPRLVETLSARRFSSAADASAAVLGALRDFVGKAAQSDDITLLALRYAPSDAAPR